MVGCLVVMIVLSDPIMTGLRNVLSKSLCL